MTTDRSEPVLTGAAQTQTADPDTLGATLERVRLTHRARRVEMVLAQLDERRRERSGPVPTGLDQAIEGFADELTLVRAQLSDVKRLDAVESRSGAF